MPKPLALALVALLAGSRSIAAPAEDAAGPETLAVDAPRTTVKGNRFVAPEGWGLRVKEDATILETPEGNSWIALVDVPGGDAAAALAAAWALYRPEARWPVKVTDELPDKDGWSAITTYTYRTSPSEKRTVWAGTRKANHTWTVILYDMDLAVEEKRAGQIALVLGRLLPRGYERETFAGKRARKLDEASLTELERFVRKGLERLHIPGAAMGIVQDGKVVLAEGYGVRTLGEPMAPDADTLFMIGSTTKAMTTLMLGKLVAERKMTWETPARELLPSFALGDADTTAKVRVKHLICACTGMPRQDFEFLFQFGDLTAEGVLKSLATMQPTSAFGELYQYSNPLAAAGGFLGGHVAAPHLELGEAYDRAMAGLVFQPLGMTATTFDFEKALAGNHAAAHAPDVDGRATRAVFEIDSCIVPVRPAGGAWSNVRDMLRYVQMELAEGMLPDGTRYIPEEVLRSRREPQVVIGEDEAYGMGLLVNRRYGIPLVYHGGHLIGYHTEMMWLPEHGVGAVLLTNSEDGWTLREQFRRKLLEELFEGRKEADASLEAEAKIARDLLAAERKLLTIPPDPALASRLASRYRSPTLGEILVTTAAKSTVFDFGEWKSEVASRVNPDGSVSFVTISPGVATYFEFLVDTSGERALVLRDAQHGYRFVEQRPER